MSKGKLNLHDLDLIDRLHPIETDEARLAHILGSGIRLRQVLRLKLQELFPGVDHMAIHRRRQEQILAEEAEAACRSLGGGTEKVPQRAATSEKKISQKSRKKRLIDALLNVQDNETRINLIMNSGLQYSKTFRGKLRHLVPDLDHHALESRVEEAAREEAERREIRAARRRELEKAATEAREKQREQSRIAEARRRIRTELLPLKGVKLLDALIRDERFWSANIPQLEEAGLSMRGVSARKVTIAERKAAAVVRKRGKERAENLEKAALVLRRLKDHAYQGFGIEIRPDPENDEAFRLEFSMRALPLDDCGIISGQQVRFIEKALGGFFERNRHPYSTVGAGISERVAPENVLKMFDQANRTVPAIQSALDLRPGVLEQVNLPDAARIVEIPEAAFRDCVRDGHVTVASTETFRKWGKTLTAQRFDIGTLVFLKNMGVFRRFMKRREESAARARRAGAVKAKATRAHREQLREALSADMQRIRRKALQDTGSLADANHIELFTWAQRASRRAKSFKAEMSACYDMKDDALIALHEAGALSLSFVDGGRTYLVEKCDIHSDGWYEYYELEDCRRCKFGHSEYYSLYAMSLKKFPDQGTLHMPYPSGIAAGMPDRKQIPDADHDRSDAYGRKLDGDEKAIFRQDEIRKEIERLVRIISGENPQMSEAG